MKYALSLAIALAVSGASADTRSDILALTGNRELRAAWTRTVWCDSNYNPIKSQLGQSEKHTLLMVWSTSEPAPRVLDPEGDHGHTRIFINRKDGSQVLWVNQSAKTVWIQAFDGKSPKRSLSLGADYDVVSLEYNPATGEEDMYVRSADMKTVYRIPFAGGYTPDLARKTQVIFPEEFNDGKAAEVDESLSASGDGKMIGCALPWPRTRIVDVAAKKAYERHTGNFGCNAQIAPDNSYRFWQFYDEHDRLNLWGANLSDNMVEVPLTNALPGSTINGPFLEGVSGMDCGDPRFTSDAQFMTLDYPGPFGGDHTFADGSSLERAYQDGEYGLDAAHVKQLPPSRVQHFVLGKFNAGFTAVQEVLIAGGDVRIREADHGGMAWIASTAGPAGNAYFRPLPREPFSLAIAGRSLNLSLFPSAGPSAWVTLLNARGAAVPGIGAGDGAFRFDCPAGGNYFLRIAVPGGKDWRKGVRVP